MLQFTSLSLRNFLGIIHDQKYGSNAMTRPITLFTGQWADLPLKELVPLAKSMGYQGLELACWGDHFNVQEALNSPG